MVAQRTRTGEGMNMNSASGAWRPLLIAGAILAVLGVLAIAFPFATGIGVELAIGGLLVVGGIVHGWHAFGARGWTGFLGGVALAALYLIAGLVVLANPVLGMVTLTLLVGAFFLVDAIVELYMGFRVRPEANWTGLLASGVLSLVLAGLILIGWPATVAWTIGLLVGINLLTTGLAMAAIAMGGRRMARTEARSEVA